MSDPKEDKGAQVAGVAILLLLFVAAIGIVFIVTSREEKNKPRERVENSEEDDEIDLHAEVRFDGSQFIITNKDSFAWRNVKLEINSRLIRSGFILKTEMMRAGETYTVGAMQFAKPDGTRFNPFTMKPNTFWIRAETADGKTGYYSGEWDNQ